MSLMDDVLHAIPKVKILLSQPDLVSRWNLLDSEQKQIASELVKYNGCDIRLAIERAYLWGGR